jgi:hypothetical protein
VGKIEERSRTSINLGYGLIKGRLMETDLQVAQVLKGSSVGTSVPMLFFLSDEFIGYPGIGGGEYAVFFLHSGNAGYTFADPYHPYLPAVPGVRVTEAGPLTSVTAELREVLITSSVPLASKRSAIEALETLRTKAATDALIAGTRSADQSAGIYSLAALLQRDDIDFLPEAEKIIINSGSGVPASFVDDLAWAIREGASDPRAIPVLINLLSSPNSTVRIAAVSALRRTRSPIALPALARALYDSDPAVRFQSMGGLADITGHARWTPCLCALREAQTKFLAHWRNWAEQQGYHKPTNSKQQGPQI